MHAFVILHEIQMSKVVTLRRQRHEIQTSQNASGKSRAEHRPTNHKWRASLRLLVGVADTTSDILRRQLLYWHTSSYYLAQVSFT